MSYKLHFRPEITLNRPPEPNPALHPRHSPTTRYSMTETVEPKLEFRSLSEDAVLAALRDTDPTNPIAVEVARLINGYTGNFQAHVERLGHVPSDNTSHKATLAD